MSKIIAVIERPNEPTGRISINEEGYLVVAFDGHPHQNRIRDKGAGPVMSYAEARRRLEEAYPRGISSWKLTMQ